MIGKPLRQRIGQQAGQRCGYCQTQERISGIPLTFEHILPRSLGGANEEENLWLSCRLCNEAKGVFVESAFRVRSRRLWVEAGYHPPGLRRSA